MDTELNTKVWLLTRFNLRKLTKTNSNMEQINQTRDELIEEYLTLIFFQCEVLKKKIDNNEFEDAAVVRDDIDTVVDFYKELISSLCTIRMELVTEILETARDDIKKNFDIID